MSTILHLAAPHMSELLDVGQSLKCFKACFLVLIVLIQKLFGANFYVFCNYGGGVNCKLYQILCEAKP